jgi:transcriptional antiterminator RfaH
MSRLERRESARWYVVHTKPKQEARATKNLERWGLETLSPWIHEAHIARQRQGTQYRVSPLFPGYIFARFDAATLLAKVRMTRGVHDVIGFGEYATPIDDAVISVVRDRIGDDGLVRQAELQPGDAVQIIDGPLRALVGIFEGPLRGQDRVLVLLATLGSQTHAQIARAHIRKSTI